MTVGILGLGLIGGSMARAYAKAGHVVFAADKDEMMLSFAQLAGAVTDALTDDNIGMCDLILLAIYPAGRDVYKRQGQDNFPLLVKTP